jgi:sucrose phosphorylase
LAEARSIVSAYGAEILPEIHEHYYVGLLAGENDIELLEKTKVGRDINRHYYSKDEIVDNLQRPVLQRLFALMKFRNEYPAFNGEVRIGKTGSGHLLELSWRKDEYETVLRADLKTYRYTIDYIDVRTGKYSILHDEFGRHK